LLEEGSSLVGLLPASRLPLYQLPCMSHPLHSTTHTRKN
jgi:hypothetical protein